MATSQVKELSPVLVQVQSEIPWDRVSKQLAKTLDNLQRTAHIKGFRPGKAPLQLIKKMFGDRVKNDVTSELIEAALYEAVREHQLFPVARPEIDDVSFNEGNSVTWTAKLEIRPRVDAVQTQGLEVTRPAVTVSDEEVTNEVERLRKNVAEVRPVSDSRPAKADDVLLIDYTVKVDGEEKPELSANDRQILLGGGQLLPEIDNGLLGIKVGEIRSIDVKFDENARDDLKNKTCTFVVTVKEHRERILPELDDEFAKDVGPYQTMLELRLGVRERLETAAKKRTEAEVRQQVVDKLVELNPIPVPPSLLEQQMRAMQQELAAFMQYSGGNELADELQKTIAPSAERKVRAALLFGEIARIQKLQVTKEDIEKFLAQQAERTGKHIAKVRAEYQGEKREDLESQLLEGKILDYLLAEAKITDAPATA